MQSQVVFGKQQELFPFEMLQLPPDKRESNKRQIAMAFERFYGMSVKQIEKYISPERLIKYDMAHKYGSGKKYKKIKKDDIARTMYGVFRYTDEFVAMSNVIIKTHVIYNKYPNEGESVSLPAFNFLDVKYTPWEESDLYKSVVYNEFLFLVFENNIDRKGRRRNENTYLTCICYVKIKDGDIVEIRKVYERTKSTIWNGIKVWPLRDRKGNIMMCPKNKERPVMGNNLPKEYENPVCHVRPHGSPDNQVKIDGVVINPQSFWLNKSFVRRMINENRPMPLF